ncbi:serine/threonine-protein kinase [Fimbriiglobus ruber]|uniref:Serine/threonine protein kinase PrkC, regulator of stationary phase n=1 Tax=Fimbriiglobus ruber TaxID=1908690 RepID=A0A225DYF2_9BACT|nr:serine/threonine-protein kinase [Fimbriiglobus ruber]OWK46352.1 Serine/threonine protein kinase PrkC, regulator of stationary phase [Fimbriiglobus ruber]
MPPPPTSTPVPAVADFLRDVARSRVLDAGRVERLFEEAPPGKKWPATTLADHFVELGALTRFQADKVLRGHWGGLILGPYRLLCPLGRGGMGIVYLARAGDPPPPGADAAGSQLVALKVLPPHRVQKDERMLARFRREGDTGLRLPAHPRLVRTIAAGEHAGVYYLALEFVRGRTARQYLSEDGPFAVPRAARVFADAAVGLHQAHAAGFVHRDFKPSNVMVEPNGRAKVLDFGLATFRGEPALPDSTQLVEQGYAIGTADYMAPEQAENPVTVGPAADLYSLGCSLYYALAGCPPFPGGTSKDKIRWHRTSAPPPITQLNPAVPPGLADLIAALMSKCPEDRPASAQEAADRLAAWAEPVRATAAQLSTALTTEVLHQAEEKWYASHLAGEEESSEDSLVVPVDPIEPATASSVPSSPAVAQPLDWVLGRTRLPKWAFPAATTALALALALAAGFGWVIARVVARASLF